MEDCDGCRYREKLLVEFAAFVREATKPENPAWEHAVRIEHMVKMMLERKKKR